MSVGKDMKNGRVSQQVRLCVVLPMKKLFRYKDIKTPPNFTTGRGKCTKRFMCMLRVQRYKKRPYFTTRPLLLIL